MTRSARDRVPSYGHMWPVVPGVRSRAGNIPVWKICLTRANLLSVMRVIENRAHSSRRVLRARVRRITSTAVSYLMRTFRSAWSQAFPMHMHDGPDLPPTFAKAAALHEGAVLTESVDAIAEKHVA